MKRFKRKGGGNIRVGGVQGGGLVGWLNRKTKQTLKSKTKTKNEKQLQF